MRISYLAKVAPFQRPTCHLNGFDYVVNEPMPGVNEWKLYMKLLLDNRNVQKAFMLRFTLVVGGEAGAVRGEKIVFFS